VRFNSQFLRKTSCSNVESVRPAGSEQVVVLLTYAYTVLAMFDSFCAGRLSQTTKRPTCPLPKPHAAAANLVPVLGTRTLRPATTEHVQADSYWLHSPRPGYWCVVAQSPNQNTASRLPRAYLATYSILRAHIDFPCDPVLYYRRGKETGGGCSTRPPELSAITTSNFLLLTISLL